MAETFQLEVATPERLLILAKVTEAQIPAASGMIGILPNHAALLGELADITGVETVYRLCSLLPLLGLLTWFLPDIERGRTSWRS